MIKVWQNRFSRSAVMPNKKLQKNRLGDRGGFCDVWERDYTEAIPSSKRGINSASRRMMENYIKCTDYRPA